MRFPSAGGGGRPPHGSTFPCCPADLGTLLLVCSSPSSSHSRTRAVSKIIRQDSVMSAMLSRVAPRPTASPPPSNYPLYHTVAPASRVVILPRSRLISSLHVCAILYTGNQSFGDVFCLDRCAVSSTLRPSTHAKQSERCKYCATCRALGIDARPYTRCPSAVSALSAESVRHPSMQNSCWHDSRDRPRALPH